MFRAELFKLKILFSLPQTINLLFVKREIGSHILIRWNTVDEQILNIE